MRSLPPSDSVQVAVHCKPKPMQACFVVCTNGGCIWVSLMAIDACMCMKSSFNTYEYFVLLCERARTYDRFCACTGALGNRYNRRKSVRTPVSKICLKEYFTNSKINNYSIEHNGLFYHIQICVHFTQIDMLHNCQECDTYPSRPLDRSCLTRCG